MRDLTAVAAVDAIKAYKVQLQTHIEDHVEVARRYSRVQGSTRERRSVEPSHSLREKRNARPTR